MSADRRAVLLLSAWTCAALLVAAPAARAGALEECRSVGDHAAVTACLLAEDRKANEELGTAEAAAAQRAKGLESATAHSGAYAALAKTVRDFAQYRTSQCNYVKETYASGTGAEEAMLGCRIDLTRRRVRELKP